MNNYFNDNFEASHNKIEDYYEVNYPELNKYDLKIDQYSDLFKLINKKKIFPSLLGNNDYNYSDYNVINDGNLLILIYFYMALEIK